MALTILVTPQTGDTIEAATWVNEFNNIYNNSLSLISPLTGTLNINNNTLTNLALGSASAPSLYFNSDANTGIYSRTADTFNVTTGSSLALEVGASWILAAAPEDSRTDSVDVVGIVRSTTSGTPAAGIGVGIAFQAESGDENPSTFGRIDFAATDVGAGTEDTYMDILLRVAGVAEETKYRFASTAGTGFQGTFTHAATVDRTWTLPDATTTLVGTDVTQTLTNKEMTTIELGHASDTTLARTAAGRMTIEAVEVLRSTGLKKIDYIRKTANNANVNNSTTLVNDDHLLTALVANEVVSFIAHIFYTSGGTTADFKMAFTVPTAASVYWSAVNGIHANTAFSGISIAQNVDGSGSTLSIGGDANNRAITLVGTVRNAGNAGNLQFQFAQDVAEAVNTLTLIDSYMVVFRE